jgi:hypothetical protein
MLVRALLAIGLALTTVLPAVEAYACGGCFVGPVRSSQVTGHRMMLVVSQESTVLYDQFDYVGEAEDFAWVLPIRGQLEVGLGTDWLLSTFDQGTTPVLEGPFVDCPGSNPPPFDDCYSVGPGPGPSSGGTTTGEYEVVEVLTQETVGPYESVQLSSSDPEALTTWLQTRGYAIPDDLTPVLATYIAEKFDFLVLRLQPGLGVQSMRPVWVKAPGASFELPLRMVAAGTGVTTAMSLFVLSEGRYRPQNFPSFTIDPGALVWSFDENRSNYRELRSEGFAESAGFAWLTEASFSLQADFAQKFPERATDPEDQAAALELANFVAPLTDLRLTRLSAELSRDALATDLRLEADPDQSELIPYFIIDAWTGQPCAPLASCGEEEESGGGGAGGATGEPLNVRAEPASGCTLDRNSGGSTPALGLLALAALAAQLRRYGRKAR